MKKCISKAIPIVMFIISFISKINPLSPLKSYYKIFFTILSTSWSRQTRYQFWSSEIDKAHESFIKFCSCFFMENTYRKKTFLFSMCLSVANIALARNRNKNRNASAQCLAWAKHETWTTQSQSVRQMKQVKSTIKLINNYTILLFLHVNILILRLWISNNGITAVQLLNRC